MTDAGLEHREALEGLERLDLWHPAATPEGVDRPLSARPGREAATGADPANP